MATTPSDALQDQEHFRSGREVELGCDACGLAWFVHVADGEDLTYEQTICPDNSCDGEGEEV